MVGYDGRLNPDNRLVTADLSHKVPNVTAHVPKFPCERKP